ncbi:MAG: peptidoglycan DD-metalloendopeptidase family protein [Patescibacteria group bacterium]
MKLFQDYKRGFSFLLVGILLIIPLVFSNAQTAQELNDKISQKNSDIAKLEAEIKSYQNELTSLSKQKSSLAGSIKELDITRKKLNADIAITQDKIDKTNLIIKGLSSQILTKEDSISNDIQAITLDIRKISEFEEYDLIEVLLSKNNFTDIWNDIDSIIFVREKIRERISELRLIKVDLEDTRVETTDARNELVVLKNKLADQKKIVDQNTKEKNKLLSQTKNSESAYQKLLQDRLVKKIAFEKEITDYESQLKFILDPSSLPGKGSLSWPLDYIYVTSPFGPRTLGGVAGFHNGTDFKAAVGTPVKAASDGTVKGIGDTDATCFYKTSFGKFIFIKHNNGLATTYAHLSLIKVKEGQKVKKGEVIGYSGNTGHSTGPHLHFSVYVAKVAEMTTRPSTLCPGETYRIPMAPTDAYLNPMLYLPK